MVQWFCHISAVWMSYLGIISQYDSTFDLKISASQVTLTNLQQHVAENRAKPVRTMAESFNRKPFLFSEVLSTVLDSFISEIDSQYAENMWYSHPRWGCANWFSGKHFSIENGILTIDSENFQSIVTECRKRLVAKCDQTLVWVMKFIPKDHPENEFGRPKLGRGYRKFYAYLWSISEINLFQTAQRTEAITLFFSEGCCHYFDCFVADFCLAKNILEYTAYFI